MKSTAWCDSSSSSSDDEDFISKRVRKHPKVTDVRSSSRQRPKRAGHQSPRLSAFSSEETRNRQRQSEASTPSSSRKTGSISLKPPLASCSSFTRKRRLPQPSHGCGNLSDTSSSSSDDSLIFRNSHSLTSTTKIAKKTPVIQNHAKGTISDNTKVSISWDKNACSSPGIKLLNFEIGKENLPNSATDNIPSDTKTNSGDDSSDSDDTAELVRQLTGKPRPIHKCATGSSLPPQKHPGASSSSSPKTKASPYWNHSGDTTKASTRLSHEMMDQDINDADDEGSLIGEKGDGFGNSTTRQQKRSDSPGTERTPQNLRERVVTENQSNCSSDLRNQSSPNKSLSDSVNTSPVRFELPPQSSSSEESSDSDEEEWGDDDAEERGDDSKNVHERYSFERGIVAAEDESNRNGNTEVRHQISIPDQENFRGQQEEKGEHLATKTDRELFEAAFNDHIRRDHDVAETNGGYFDGKMPEERDLNQPVPLTAQHIYRHRYDQQPCIDLVDSDDCEQEKESQRALNGTFLQEHNLHQEHSYQSQSRVFENDQSPRSPSRRRSPGFNVASRSFIHNKPWTGTNNRDREREEHDDVIEFEDDDRKLPARPRRVTQDHTSHFIHHSNNGAGHNPYCQQKRNLNPSDQHELSSGHQQHGHSIQASQLSRGVGNIPRPWPSNTSQTTTRRLRDPTASNLSLAASVVVKNSARGARTISKSTTPSTSRSSRNRTIQRSTDQNTRDDMNMGDIRTFMSRRPSLVNETRNRARSIETVRASRHDIQGHADVTVINHPSSSKATGRRPRSKSHGMSGREVEEEEVIEVFENEEAPAKTRNRRSTVATAANTKTKTKRKRTTTRKTKARKAGGRKRTRRTGSAGGRGKSRGRGAGGRFGRRGGNRSTNHASNDSGAWGPSDDVGWTSARPVRREDPAFKNVGAEISF